MRRLVAAALAMPAVTLLSCLCVVGAHAQALQGALSDPSGSNFARDRNVSVRARPHPEYDSPPHRVGAFLLRPQITASGEYNDNIYATDTDKQDDLIAQLRPRLDVQSTWSRNAVTAYAESAINQYVDATSQNTTDWGLGANGRLDVIRGANLSMGADAGHFTESRTVTSTQFDSVKPIRYYSSGLYVAGVREINRLRLSSRFDLRDFNYQDGISPTGTPVQQDDRDRTAKSILGRADYAVSPATALFVQVSGNWRDYRLKAPLVALQRDSHGYEALAGANFELSNLVRGELGVGYLSQTFKDPIFRDINGLGARGQLEWFPTQLTTVTGTVSRTVEDSGLPASSGYLSTNTGLQVDHELLRNLVLTGQAGYGRDAYRGLDRQDHRLTLGASATLLMNRRLSLVAGYTLFDVKSYGLARGFDFTVNRVTLGLKARL